MNNFEKLYDIMCASCLNAKKCHEECEECDEFNEALEEMEND